MCGTRQHVLLPSPAKTMERHAHVAPSEDVLESGAPKGTLQNGI